MTNSVKIKKFLEENINELEAICDDKSGEYDDLEQHDARIALETYQTILDYFFRD